MRTPRGTIETPAFMPVGTQGSIKCLSMEQMESLGAEIILGNTYHLHIRPGDELVARGGGLHNFISWPKPILTDSGGFQVFSLATLNKITDEGVKFQSHHDGARLFIGPAESIRIQENLGSDIMMAFDECPPYPVDESRARESWQRTLRWEKQCLDIRQNLKAALFAITQGSFFKDIRLESANALLDLDFDGYAIGGVSVGEPQELSREVIDYSEPLLPKNKPRYVMGIGKPGDILSAVEMGIDMFDCVIPTRNARGGGIFTARGPIHITNEKFKEDFGPLDQTCSCAVCGRYNRAYIRHLFNVKEVGGIVYSSYHNIHFYLQLMRDIRASIETGTFMTFKKNFLNAYQEEAES